MVSQSGTLALIKEEGKVWRSMLKEIIFKATLGI